jgi:cyclopropane fatty-acyl-phospholipid synthase-like methyltransferase
MPSPSSPTIAPLADASPIARAGVPADRKARFWDRTAVKYAADPIADMAGYEATLRRVQGPLSADQDVLEIGFGTGSTALRLAPNTGRLLATDVSAGMIAIARQGMDIVSVERHGTRGKDFRVFIVARKPA